MELEVLSRSPVRIRTEAAAALVAGNGYTAPFGLVLTEAQALELVDTRTQALYASGRIEFGDSVTGALIRAFCDSPYLSVPEHMPVLHGLIELFYTYKNETWDRISDDDLIRFMRAAFDGEAGGSLELLETALDRLAHSLRRPADGGAQGRGGGDA